MDCACCGGGGFNLGMSLDQRISEGNRLEEERRKGISRECKWKKRKEKKMKGKKRSKKGKILPCGSVDPFVFL